MMKIRVLSNALYGVESSILWSQKAVSVCAYFPSKQIMPFGFAEQY